MDLVTSPEKRNILWTPEGHHALYYKHIFLLINSFWLIPGLWESLNVWPSNPPWEGEDLRQDLCRSGRYRTVAQAGGSQLCGPCCGRTTLSLDCHVSPPRCLAQGLQRKQVAGCMGWTESLMGRTVFTEESEVAQSWPTLCDPMDCSLPGASVHGIFQARILEWVAISFSRGSSQPRDQTQVSHIVGRLFNI